MGFRFNGFLIGDFFGFHLIYLMPYKHYVNFLYKVAVPFEEEYHNKNTSAWDCVKVLASGVETFLIGKDSPYEEIIVYLEDNQYKKH